MGWTEGAALFNRGHWPTDAIWQQEKPVDEVKPLACVPTVEHREPKADEARSRILPLCA
jgi:hypothetical protein